MRDSKKKQPVNPFTVGTRKSGDLQGENTDIIGKGIFQFTLLKYPLII